MAVKAEAATFKLEALSETNINWERSDETKFHLIGAALFTALSALLHPISAVKNRMLVDEASFAHMNGLSVCRNILRNDGIHGIFRGFGTSAVGDMPGRVLALTSLEVSKEKICQQLMVQGLPGTTVCNCPFDAACKVLRAEGFRGLYRGFGLTAVTETPA